MSVCCSSVTSAAPSTPCITSRTRSPRRRSVTRSSPTILTAMFARVPDSMWSMRCEIGCPMATFVPGSPAKLAPQLRQQLLARPLRLAQADVDFRRLDALHVLVELGAARAPGRGHDLGLRQQNLLDPRADLVRLAERRPRQRVHADGQAALVELGKKRGAEARRRRPRRPAAAPPRPRSPAAADRARTGSTRANRDFSALRDAAFVAADDRRRARQERVAQRRRDDDRDRQRREQRDDVGLGQRREQPALDAASGRRSAGTPAR